MSNVSDNKLSKKDNNSSDNDAFEKILDDNWQLIDQQKFIVDFKKRFDDKKFIWSDFLDAVSGSSGKNNNYYTTFYNMETGRRNLKTKRKVYENFMFLKERANKKDKNLITAEHLRECISTSIQTQNDQIKGTVNKTYEDGLNDGFQEAGKFVDKYIGQTKDIISGTISKIKELKEVELKNETIETSDDKKNINKNKIVNIKKNDKKFEININKHDLLTFEEIWDGVHDKTWGEDLIETAKKDLKAAIISKADDEIKPFIKEEGGDPLLEFKGHHNKQFSCDFDTAEITNQNIIQSIINFSEILDKRAELAITNNHNQIISLGFPTSKEKLQYKIKGLEIFNNLLANGVNIYFRTKIKGWNFNLQHSEIKSQNTMIVTNQIILDSVSEIVFGNKEIIDRNYNENYKDIINIHADKTLGSIKRQLYFGNSVK